MSEHNPAPIILVDDEKHIRLAAGQTLELDGYEVIPLARAEGVLERIDPDWSGVIVSDINLPGIDGLELMRQVQAVDPELPVILITGHGDISMAVNAIRDGAYDFIEKPFASEFLLDTVRRAVDKRRLTLENRRLRQELESQSAPGASHYRQYGADPAVAGAVQGGGTDTGGCADHRRNRLRQGSGGPLHP